MMGIYQKKKFFIASSLNSEFFISSISKPHFFNIYIPNHFQPKLEIYFCIFFQNSAFEIMVGDVKRMFFWNIDLIWKKYRIICNTILFQKMYFLKKVQLKNSTFLKVNFKIVISNCTFCKNTFKKLYFLKNL